MKKTLKRILFTVALSSFTFNCSNSNKDPLEGKVKQEIVEGMITSNKHYDSWTGFFPATLGVRTKNDLLIFEVWDYGTSFENFSAWATEGDSTKIRAYKIYDGGQWHYADSRYRLQRPTIKTDIDIHLRDIIEVGGIKNPFYRQ